MTTIPPGARLAAGAITLPLLAALAWWLPTAGEPESGSGRPFVQLPPPPVTATAPGTASASSVLPTVPTDSQTLPDPRIAKTLEDPGATFRNIRSADGAHTIVCGEVRGSGRSYYRRFVWIAEVQMLATDDGGPQFSRVAELCDGSASLGPV